MKQGRDALATTATARRVPGFFRWWMKRSGISATIALVAGCATGGSPSYTHGLDGPRHATMEVRNDHRHRIDVSVLRSDGGIPIVIGHVEPNANRGFRLPMPLNRQPVKVVVECRVTRDSYSTREVVWEPTQVVALSVGSHLPLTKLALH